MVIFNRPPPEPVSERQMTRHFYDGFNTICQYLRDIYHMTDDEEIRFKLRVAMSMAKSMDKQLREYYELYNEGEGI
jgi:hypothetical protein